jgi:hypothetical protein
MKALNDIITKDVKVEKSNKKFVFTNIDNAFTANVQCGTVEELYKVPKLMMFMDDKSLEVLKSLEQKIPEEGGAKLISIVKKDNLYKRNFIKVNIKKTTIVDGDDVLDGTMDISELNKSLAFRDAYVIFSNPQVWDMVNKDTDFHSCGMFLTVKTIIVKGKKKASELMNDMDEKPTIQEKPEKKSNEEKPKSKKRKKEE